MQEALSGGAFAGDERFERWTEEQLFYQSLGGEGDDFEGLKARIEEVEGENDLSGNRVVDVPQLRVQVRIGRRESSSGSARGAGKCGPFPETIWTSSPSARGITRMSEK